MRVLMLGWEFPPYIAGGLGTACFGLTRALSQLGVDVLFVLPRPASGDGGATPAANGQAANGPTSAGAADMHAHRESVGAAMGASALATAQSVEFTKPIMPPPPVMPPLGYVQPDLPRLEHVEFRTVNVRLVNPYQSALEYTTERFVRHLPALPTALPSVAVGDEALAARARAEAKTPSREGRAASHAGKATFMAKRTVTANPPTEAVQRPSASSVYSSDLYSEVKRYADLALNSSRGEPFDVIHAHDWMTFPAALAIAGATGRPMVVHVHSTEYDRAGTDVDPRIVDIERRGMAAALRVVAVSHFTKTVIVTRYGIDPSRVDVVYNAIDAAIIPPAAYPRMGQASADQPRLPHAAFVSLAPEEKVVLFMGRITHQKGPEYFLAAAKKVLSVMPGVKFVMAGSGDMSRRIVDMAHELGIAGNIVFTGFLRGPDVDRVFELADCYVMPSVSEPFGLAPLEAMLHDVPVIISRQSGVAEILRHALKADFWDTTDLADKIVSVLKHPPLTGTLKKHAAVEVKRLSWQDSAANCLKVYASASSALRG
jgi:glycosyltransferase involved in cell wall biosynthesis